MRDSSETLPIRRIGPGDAPALMAFYNGLSEASIRTFRPLGLSTDLARCEVIVHENTPEAGKRFGLVAMGGSAVVAWGFLAGMDTERPDLGLGVAEAYHGRRLGSRLMDALMEAARAHEKSTVALCVVQENSVAWRLYENRGFVRTGEDIRDEGLAYYLMEATI
jgi:ribosomal protein S18 acetylase RimI-like enzyme